MSIELEDTESIAEKLLLRNADFTPSRGFPAPSRMPGRSLADDIAAVLTCRKPAAYVSTTIDNPDPNIEIMLEKAEEMGMPIVEVTYKRTPFHIFYLVGKLEPLKHIYNLLTHRDKIRKRSIVKRRLGRFLGYPTTAVNNFTSRTSRHYGVSPNKS